MTRREKREARKAATSAVVKVALPTYRELHERQEQMRQAWRDSLTLATLNAF